MTNILNTLFGGQQQSTGNQAYPYLQGALGGGVANGGAASNQLSNLLGLGGGPAQAQGFDNWKNSTGYQFGLNQGVQGLVGNAATKGLLNSGSTAQGIDTYGQNYANTQFQNYLNPLQSLMSNGTANAGVLADAGKTSQSTSNPGAGGFIGSLLAK